MGTLFIDRKDTQIKLDGNCLAFYTDGKKEGSVPILPLKKVIVVGTVNLETPVLHKLAGENISVIFLSGRNLRFGGMLHGSLHKNAILRLKQYHKALTPFSVEFSKQVVTKKISSQINFIDELLNARTDLRYELLNTKKSLDTILKKICERSLDIECLRGYEGGAASTYFSMYTQIFPPSLNFCNRNRRPPEDPVNAMLSLSYTLLHFEIVREIEIAGLDPLIGFYHTFEYGRESLACDLIEPLRVDADKFIWQLFRKREILENDFSKDEDRAGCYLKKNGRAKFYPLYVAWRDSINNKIKDSIKNFARSISDEENIVYD